MTVPFQAICSKNVLRGIAAYQRDERFVDFGVRSLRLMRRRHSELSEVFQHAELTPNDDDVPE